MKKLSKPNLTFKIRERRDEEKGRRHLYEGRLLYWFGSLKRMIKIRTERIQEVEKEKTELSKQIRKLQKEIDKRTEYQNELGEHLDGLNKELMLYQRFFKKEREDGTFEKSPSFYVKIQKRKQGYEYYVGRIRNFQRKGRKRREKWVYFGSVSDMNRKYGKENVIEELKKELEKIYYGE